jgi:hypothetical protein
MTKAVVLRAIMTDIALMVAGGVVMYEKVLIACAGLVLLISSVALAGVPCAGTTTVTAVGDGSCTPGAALCPNGDYDQIDVTVTVKDCYGTPLAGQTVTVNANPAGAPFCYCPDGEAAPNELEDSKVVGPTNASGVIVATFEKIGGCGNMEFYATIGTVIAGPSASIYIASPDNTGDCVVNLIDFGNFALAFNGTDPCMDYNCDGAVNLIDFGQFALHFNHSCTNPIP